MSMWGYGMKIEPGTIITDFYQIERIYLEILAQMNVNFNTIKRNFVIAEKDRFFEIAAGYGYSENKVKNVKGFIKYIDSSFNIFIRSAKVEQLIETVFHETGHSLVWGIDRNKGRVLEEVLACCFELWAIEEINKQDYGFRCEDSHKWLNYMVRIYSKKNIRENWPVHYAAIKTLDFYRKFFWGGKEVRNAGDVKLTYGRSFKDLYSILILWAFEEYFDQKGIWSI